jgi:outer membrane lipoprotein-sorting protein
MTRPHVLVTLVFLVLCVVVDLSYASIDLQTLLLQMEAAYSQVNDYQSDVEITYFGGRNGYAIERFLYTFKKPNMMRIDLQIPHSGTVLVYPDENGKVVVWRPGLTQFIHLHLSPNSRLLQDGTGQRIDQTDLGLLITNIGRSVAEARSPVKIDEDGYIEIALLAPDHFKEGITTFYNFWIDKKLMLPVRITESTPEGFVKRTIAFRNLKINTGVSVGTFRLG